MRAVAMVTFVLVTLAGAAAGDEIPSVDVNSATEQTLAALPWVGPVLAEAIVRERALGGPFRNVNDLRRVEGLDEDALAAIAPMLAAPGRDRIQADVLWRVRPREHATGRDASAFVTVRGAGGRYVSAGVGVARRGASPGVTLGAGGRGGALDVWWGRQPPSIGAPGTRAASGSGPASWVDGAPRGTLRGLSISRRTGPASFTAWCGAGPSMARPRVGIGTAFHRIAGEPCALGLRSRDGGGVVLVGETGRAVRLFGGEGVVGVRRDPDAVLLASLRTSASETGWDLTCEAGWPLVGSGDDGGPSTRSSWLRVRASHDAPSCVRLRADVSVTQPAVASALGASGRWRGILSAASAAATPLGAPRIEAALSGGAGAWSGDPNDGDAGDGSARITASAQPGARLRLAVGGARTSGGTWCVGWTSPVSGGWRLGGAVRAAHGSARAPVPPALVDVHALSLAGEGVDLSVARTARLAVFGLDVGAVVTAERTGRLRVRAVLRAAVHEALEAPVL